MPARKEWMMETIRLRDNMYEFDIDGRLDNDGDLMFAIYNNVDDTQIVMFLTPKELLELASFFIKTAEAEEDTAP